MASIRWISNRAPTSRWCTKKRSRPTSLLAFGVFALFLVISMILSSCTSTYQLRNVPLSYNAIKTVVVSNLPGGVRRESQNGRTLTSAFFIPETLKPEAANSKRHAYAVVVISGSTRPYDLEVHAFIEEKDEDGWAAAGEDDDLADRLAERLRSALADRREDRNVIDDFRAF